MVRSLEDPLPLAPFFPSVAPGGDTVGFIYMCSAINEYKIQKSIYRQGSGSQDLAPRTWYPGSGTQDLLAGM